MLGKQALCAVVQKSIRSTFAKLCSAAAGPPLQSGCVAICAGQVWPHADLTHVKTVEMCSECRRYGSAQG
jgi:hypothetical protein